MTCGVFVPGKDFQNTTTKDFLEAWNKLETIPEDWKFMHKDQSECTCGLGNSRTWADACRLLKDRMSKNEYSQAHFHPHTKINCTPHHVACGYKTICFTVHVDDLSVRHPRVKGSQYTTIGIQIHNLKAQSQRHNFFIRTAFLPADKKLWNTEHQLEIISKEMKTLQNGMPLSVAGRDGQYHLVKFVCLGVIADGPQIGKLLGRTGLGGYCGTQLIRENLRMSKTHIGTAHDPVFNSRRYLTNSVSRFSER